MRTKVYLREEKIKKEVRITSEDKPVISEVMEAKWQRVINIIAEFLNIPSGLIMKITKESMEVFLKSDGEKNPYKVGGSDSLGHGLYCESAIGNNKELHVENALKKEEWKDNPDVKLGMIAYYGLPIRWPDESFFGTICVLDSKENSFNKEYKILMQEFRDSLERDLEILEKNSQLEFFALYDQLTAVYNRRKLESTLEYEFERFHRSNSKYSLVVFDLDNFKYINDNYGHEVGDKVLIAFANAIRSSIRSVDIFGRWGGDEFLLICPDTSYDDTIHLIESIKNYVINKLNQVFSHIDENVKVADFSYGIASVESEFRYAHDIIKAADIRLYEMKTTNK